MTGRATHRTGWLVALTLLALALTALLPGGAAQAQTCPSASVGQTLNIVTSGGVTTCTNIGTAQATAGIEIYNGLVSDVHPTAFGSRFGVAFRKVTASGNEQPTAAGCVGDCFSFTPGEPVDEDVPGTSSGGIVADWGYGTGTVTLVQCASWSFSSSNELGCTVSFQFADGTSGAMTMAAHSNVIPSFSLGGAVALPPGITSVTPSVAPHNGTQQVVVRGSNFDTLASVVLNFTPQTFQIISSSEIRFNASDSFFGTTLRTLTLTNPGGTGTASMTITPALVSIDTATLPSGTHGASYSAGIAVSGGTRSVSGLGFVAYSYAATGLPAGLSINSSGVISGQPTQAGTFSATVTVIDPGFNFGNGVVWPVVSKSKTLSLTIGSTVSVTTASLAAGTLGNSYSAPLAATGGTAPYTFAATGLPAGLAVSGASITGTPTQAGTFTVGITATDSTSPTANTSTQASLSLTIGQGTPGLALAVTANPASLSAVGQTLTYTYTVRNSGNVQVTGVAVTDTRVSPVACAATTLAAGASTTCTGTTVSTAADFTARGIASSATASATFNATTVSSAAVATTVGIDVAAIQTATRRAVGQFLAQRGNMLVSAGPESRRTHGRLGGGSLTGGTGGGGGAGLTASPGQGAGFTALGGGRDPTAALSTLAQRVGQGQSGVASRGLGGPGSELRSEIGVPGRDDGDASGRPAALPFSVSGSADDNFGRFQFAASLSQARAAAAANESKKLEGADAGTVMALGLGGAAMGALATPASQTFDVWLEGSSSYFRNETASVTRRGHAAVVSAGVDMLLHPGLLVGVMAQLDWMSDSASGTSQRSEGRGWMAGPYLGARLTPNLYFDARVAWGRSDNEIDPLGAYIDTFDTTRVLASAKLTGDWMINALRFRPSAEVVWFKETQQAYENAIGIAIDSQSFNLGRGVFGPEIGYAWRLSDTTTLEPFVGLKGVWNFAGSAQTTAAGSPIGHDEIRARIEAGISYQVQSGITIRGTGAYDGIGGDGYRAIQGQAQIVVPLQ